MKLKHFRGGVPSSFAIAIVSLLVSHSVRAASAVWNGTTDSLWSTTTNWSTSPVPGSTDTATFNNAGNGNVVISLESGVTTKSLVFETANVAAYTIGSAGQTLTLEAAGSVLVNPDAANNQLFNANLALATASGAADFTLTNNSATNSLTFAGAISGVGTGDTKTLTVAGVGTTAISGNITDGVGSVAFKKDGAGVLNLSGTHNYAGATTVRQGTLNITGAITSAGHFYGGIDASKPITTLSGNAAMTLTGTANKAIVGFNNNGNPSSMVMSGNSSISASTHGFSVGGYFGGYGGTQAGSGEFAMKDNATLTMQNNTTIGFFVQGDGSSGTSHMLLRDNAVLNTPRFTVSSNYGTLTQTGGQVNCTRSSSTDQWIRISNGAGRQGWYNMTGGQFNLNANPSGTGFILSVGTNRGFGFMNITGTAQVNLANDVDFRLCSNQAGTLGYYGEVNLAGGTFSTPKVTSPDIGGDVMGGVFNFNGGVLKATRNESAFMQNLRAANNPTPGAAYVYPGGAVIDTNTFDITIAQPLLEPVGDGVTSVSFNPGTQTYVAPPRVYFANPPGNLPALAQGFATLNDSGQINGIILTKPGFGYTSVPAVSFDRGDATATCTVGAVTGGGLTKKSTGNLTLSGVNTYTGDTFIQQGGLTLASTGGLKFKIGANGVNNQITGTGSVQLDGAFLIDLTGASAVGGNSWTLVDTATLSENFGATFTVTGWTENGSDWTLPDGETGNLWKFSESTGVLTYQSASTPYQTWADGYPGTDLSDPAADADGDGVSNFEEFAFGLNPTDGASANPIVDSSDLANGVFTYTRLVDSGLTYTVWTSEDLKTWTVPENVSESPGAAVNGVQPVTVEISPLPSGSKYFVRVSAQ